MYSKGEENDSIQIQGVPTSSSQDSKAQLGEPSKIGSQPEVVLKLFIVLLVSFLKQLLVYFRVETS